MLASARPLPIALAAIALPALVALGSVACVVPMPIEAEPVEQNLPPYYITAAVSPSTDQVVEFDPELDQALELRTGPIGDPNADDRIFYRWFINYQPTGLPGIADPGPPEGLTLAELATGSIDQRLEPCVDLGGSAFDDLELHTVQVVIADRPFVADDDDSPTPNQTVPDGAFKTKLVWFIRFDRSKCP